MKKRPILQLALARILAVSGAAIPIWLPGADWFASPEGDPAAAGTRAEPWDLQSALDGPGAVQPGDVIWLLPGTYRHPDRSDESSGFVIRLSGAPDAPVTIRNHNNARATIDGGLITAAPDAPKHVRIWGLEIVVGETLAEGGDRKIDEAGSHPKRNRPVGGVRITAGHDLKFINNIVHSNSQGFGFWKTVSGDSELYGNIVFDNGWEGPDRHHGHGLYTQNGSGDYKFVRDNLFLQNWGRCLQAYGSNTTIEKYNIEGNVFQAFAAQGSHEVIFGGSKAAGNREAQFRHNLHYQAILRLGFASPAHDVEVSDCFFIRSSLAAREGSTGIVDERNLVWRREHPTRPTPDDIVFLRPNRCEPDLAYLTLVQPTRQSPAMKVDLSGFLESGDRFEIRPARDIFGKPATAGEYDGEEVSIPVGGAEFSAWVIRRVAR